MKGTSHQVDDVTGHRFVTGHTSPVRHSFGAFHLPSPGGWPSPHIYLPHGVNFPRSALPLVAMSLGPCLYCQVYSSEKFSPSYIPPPYTLLPSLIVRKIFAELYPSTLHTSSYIPLPYTPLPTGAELCPSPYIFRTIPLHPIPSGLRPSTPYVPGYARGGAPPPSLAYCCTVCPALRSFFAPSRRPHDGRWRRWP